VTFEERLSRLEEIAGTLEGDIELASALALFEEGIELLRSAASELGAAELRVQKLVERADGAFEVESRE